MTVDGQLISTISKGLLVFAAIGKDDTQKEAESMASKVLKVKLWDDDAGTKWKKNVQEIDGEVLCGARLMVPIPRVSGLSALSLTDRIPSSLSIHAFSIDKERQ